MMLEVIQWGAAVVLMIMGAGGVAVVWPTRRKQLRYRSGIVYSGNNTTTLEDE